MTISDFVNISMNGRMAYLILCVEKYLLSKYPDTDWSILAKWMWKSTSDYWDEWGNKFIEIIPEYLFEFDSYETSDFEAISKDEYLYFSNLFRDKQDIINELLQKLYDMQEVYIYTSIPGNGNEAIQIVLDMCNLLENENVPLPELSIVSFSSFKEKDGWGENFDGEKLSLILNK